MAISSPGWVNQAKKNIVKDLGEEETPGPSIEHLEWLWLNTKGEAGRFWKLVGHGVGGVVVSEPLCPQSHSWAMGWAPLERGQR